MTYRAQGLGICWNGLSPGAPRPRLVEMGRKLYVLTSEDLNLRIELITKDEEAVSAQN